VKPAKTAVRAGGTRASKRKAAPPPHGNVLSFDERRIALGLQGRTRYKYVQPRVVREGLGWKVVSENCSRNIDAQGGEIDIAWLLPRSDGGWLLYSRDHARGCWQLRLTAGTLAAVMERLCTDPDREFWQ
jgi:hypothetical protein